MFFWSLLLFLNVRGILQLNSTSELSFFCTLFCRFCWLLSRRFCMPYETWLQYLHCTYVFFFFFFTVWLRMYCLVCVDCVCMFGEMWKEKKTTKSADKAYADFELWTPANFCFRTLRRWASSSAMAEKKTRTKNILEVFTFVAIHAV